MASKVLTLASALLFVVGLVGIFSALMFMTAPLDEATLGVTVSQIRGFSPNVMGLITHLYQSVGIYLLGMGIFFCVVSWVPFRKGEKWAWYSMLIVGGVGAGGQLVFAYLADGVIASFYLPSAAMLLVLWAVAIVLPIRDVFS